MLTWASLRNGTRYGLAREGQLRDLKLDKEEYQKKAQIYLNTGNVDALLEYIKLFKNKPDKPVIKTEGDVTAITVADGVTLFIAKKKPPSVAFHLGAPVKPVNPSELRSSRFKELRGINQEIKEKVDKLAVVKAGGATDIQMEELSDEMSDLSEQMSDLTQKMAITQSNIDSISRQLNLPPPSTESNTEEIKEAFQKIGEQVEKLKNDEFVFSQVKRYLTSLAARYPGIDEDLSGVLLVIRNKTELTAAADNEYMDSVIAMNMQYDNLSNQLQEMQAHYDDLKEQYGKKQKTLREYNEAILNTQEVSEKLELEIKQATDLRNKLSRELGRLDRQAAQKSQEVTQLQEQSSALVEQVATLEATKKRIQEEYDQRKSEAIRERDEALQELTEAKQELAEKTNLLETITTETKDKRTKYDRAMDDLGNLENKVRDVSMQLKTLDGQSQRARDEYRTLEEQIQDDARTIEEKRQVFFDLERLIADSKQQLEELRPRQEELDRVKRQLATSKKDLSTLETDKKEVEREISDMGAKLADQRLSLDQTRRDEERVASDLQMKESELTWKEQALQELEVKQARLLADTKRDIDENVKQLNTITGQLSIKQALMDRLDESIRKLYPDSTSIPLVEVTERLESLAKQIEQEQGALLKVNRETTEASEQLSRMNDLVKKTQGKSELLKGEQLGLSRLLRDTRADLANQMAALAKVISEMGIKQAQVDKIDMLIKKLFPDTESITVEEAIRQLEEIGNEIASEKKVLTDVQRATAEATTELETLRSTIASTQGQYEQLVQDVQQLTNTKNGLENDISNLERQLATLKTEVVNASAEKDDLERELSKLSADEQMLQTKITRLTGEEAEYARKIAELQMKYGDLVKKKSELEGEVKDQEKRRDDLDKEVKRLEAAESASVKRQEEIENDVATLLARKGALLSIVKMQESEILTNSALIDQLASAYIQSVIKYADMRAAVTVEENRLKELEKQVADAEKRKALLEAEVKQLEQEKTDLDAQIAAKKKEYDELQKKTNNFMNDIQKLLDKLEEKKVPTEDVKVVVPKALKGYTGPTPVHFVDQDHYSIVLRRKDDYYNASFPVSDVSVNQLLLFFSINTLRVSETGLKSFLIEDQYTGREIRFQQIKPTAVVDGPSKLVKDHDWWYYLPMDYEDCESDVPLLLAK